MAGWLGSPASPTAKTPMKGKIVLFYESIFQVGFWFVYGNGVQSVDYAYGKVANLGGACLK